MQVLASADGAIGVITRFQRGYVRLSYVVAVVVGVVLIQFTVLVVVCECEPSLLACVSDGSLRGLLDQRRTCGDSCCCNRCSFIHSRQPAHHIVARLLADDTGNAQAQELNFQSASPLGTF